MENRYKYNFDDFTLSNYERLLKLAIDHNYVFSGFDFEPVHKNKLIWRHDLEFCIDIALYMAKLEQSLRIKSNFFIQLHSPFYNTLEIEKFKKIEEIINAGHYIGLHFDAHFYGISDKNSLNYYIKQDKEWLETLFNIKIDAFSFHNNTKFTLSCEKDRYGGLINVYSKFFKENYRYCSDSTGFWRYERLEDVLKEKNENKGLQVLTHDGMWQDDVKSPRQRIHSIIEENGIKGKTGYDQRLKKFGGRNIDWKEIF